MAADDPSGDSEGSGSWQVPEAHFTAEQYEAHYTAKKAALERILGPMDDIVGHAIIPYAIGGAVDMYYFSRGLPGTVFATMELIEPDGSGPQPNRLGTYELVACTRIPRPLSKVESGDVPGGVEKRSDHPFNQIERRMCGVLTVLGRYGTEAVLEPGQTAELPGDEPEYVVFDEFPSKAGPFRIADRRHGLLLVIEIHPSELEFARTKGSTKLLRLLQKKGFYPYSDLDRPAVVS
jgi:hypothetical protein